MGRATQGVRVMDLATEETLVAIARLAEGDVADGDGSGVVVYGVGASVGDGVLGSSSSSPSSSVDSCRESTDAVAKESNTVVPSDDAREQQTASVYQGVVPM